MSTPVLGRPTVTLDYAIKFVWSKDAARPIEVLARHYWAMGPKYGIRPELLLAQAIWETGWGRFPGVIDASFKNPCGLKTKDGGGDYAADAHARFKSWEEGAEAHTHHVAVYAGVAGFPRRDSPDPRQYIPTPGSGKTVEELGSRWATRAYGTRLVELMNDIIGGQAMPTPNSGEPIEAARLKEILVAEGLTVVEEPGWKSRERAGSFAPIGIVNHHTASRSRTKNVPSLDVVKNGRSDLPGPLCNFLVGRHDGTVHLISDGRANDTGSGSSTVLREVQRDVAPSGDAGRRGLRDDISGNSFFYDIEVENDGVGEPYRDEVIEAVVRINVALCREKGWTANRVIQHREWTRRKIDMSWRGDLRGIVRARLEGGELPVEQAEFNKLLDGYFKADKPEEGGPTRGYQVWKALYVKLPVGPDDKQELVELDTVVRAIAKAQNIDIAEAVKALRAS